MKRISVLDCTLRDGGYMNDWKFGQKNIKYIIQKCSQAGVDIIECGFFSDVPYHKAYTLFDDTKRLNSFIGENRKKILYVGMIAIGEREIDPEKLSPAKESKVKGVRLTFHLDQQDKAFQWGEVLKNKGYKVFMQPVGSANFEDTTLLQLVEKINKFKPFAFYLVDTLGTMYPKDIRRLLYLVDNNLSKGIQLGFHSHNNLQMSFANAQEMIDFPMEREFIIDSCIYGMGRGAGNLCTELLVDYLGKSHPLQYHVIPLLECIDECMMYYYAKFPWGYSAAYFLASSKKCHPNYASYLLSKQKLSVYSISNLLDQLTDEERLEFDKNRIIQLYQKYQTHAVDDRVVRESLEEKWKGKKILILGTGATIKNNKAQIEKYIDKNKPIVISINAVWTEFAPDMVFIGNDKRYHTYRKKLDMEKTIFTSNVKDLPESSYVVNYSDLVNSSQDVSDNAGLMLIRLLQQLGVKEIALAGMDGYQGNQILNYGDNKLIGPVEPMEIQTKNISTAKQLAKFGEKCKLIFVTPTKYLLKNGGK